MSVRAKFKVAEVVKSEYAETVKFEAVYGGSTNAEDNTFSEATPSASCSLTVTNKAVWGKFVPGQKFYVDFTEAK